LIPRIRSGRDQRRPNQRVREQQQVHVIARAEVEPRGGGQEDQLRDPRLGELEQRPG
jgi:hypothetical protein